MEEILVNFLDAAYSPTRLRTMCPALMFAANRNANVNGRTSILMVSINTKNGLSHVGAPLGSSPAVNVAGENLIAEMIRVLHNGTARDSVNSRCLEVLNI